MKDGKAQRGGEEDTFQQLPIDEDVFELKASLAAKRTLTNSHIEENRQLYVYLKVGTLTPAPRQRGLNGWWESFLRRKIYLG